MSAFSDSQIEDLRELQRASQRLGAEAVMIGAMAYRVCVEDSRRETFDIDLAIALDLDGFARLEKALGTLEWSQSERQEHRWRTPRGNRLDLVPAGPALRKDGKIAWPKSGFVMSLAGFDHVFRHALPREIGYGLTFKIVPPPVLAILKIAAYLENPQRRAKDLIDLSRLMQKYEQNTDRIFSDPVFEADLPDVEFASAFLLGLDLGAIATEKDIVLIETFAERALEAEDPERSLLVDDETADGPSRFHQRISTFLRAFRPGHER